MPGAVATAAVIFLHGSGDDGPGAREYLRSLGSVLGAESFAARLEAAGVELHFPSATPISYTPSGGVLSSVWFDRPRGLAPGPPEPEGVGGHGLGPREHLASVGASVAQLHGLLDELATRGIPPRRVAIGGFSMGGGIALQAGFRYGMRDRGRGGGGGGGDGEVCGVGEGAASGVCGEAAAAGREPVGAVFALSSYLCDDAELYALLEAEAERGRAGQQQQLPPLFMRHGDRDNFIHTAWGDATAQRLAGLLGKAQGPSGDGAGGGAAAAAEGSPKVDWATVAGAGHEMVQGEVAELLAWLLRTLGLGGGA